jgi:predicted metalloprotease with PDZ domain
MKRPGPAPTFRVALTHDGTDADADAFASDVGRVVREAMPVFGELPQFDTNTYTFLSVYLPWVNGDGMEHRNSTSLTGSAALRNPRQRAGILGAVSHEFFHAWNMERIRSKGIEPFDFEEADVSDELWLGEGFTNYYDDLILERAGLESLDELLGDFAGIINSVALTRTAHRNAVDMTAWRHLSMPRYDRSHGVAQHLHLMHTLDRRSGSRSTSRCATDQRPSHPRHASRGLWANYG